MADVVDFAVALTQRGYACYPVNVTLNERGKKEPQFKTTVVDGRVLGWQEGDYPTDPAAIREHWKGFAGIAINTERSGVVLVDIDVSGGKDGFAALEEAGVELPPTPVSATSASGGKHLFYRVGSVPVDSSSSKLAKGVDIRAIGGVVFVAPTVVPGLGAYAWDDPAAMVPAGELPVFSDPLAESLRKREVRIATSTERPTLTMEQRTRMQGRLDRILRDLSTMTDGERNATMRLRMIRLFGIAMTLGEELDYVAQLARDAYFASGGGAENELESFIDWAREHARFELPEDETDEAFEAEVAGLIRRAKIQEEAKLRLSPLRVKSISDDDVLEFDPEATEGDWWIEGILPKGETVILFGTPNAGKSFAGVDLAMGVALGTQAWGRKLTGSGRAIYLAGEGVRRLALRRKVWEVFHEQTPAKDRLQFRKMRLLLASDESVAQHRNLINTTESDLIIVDTMVRAAEGLVLENPGEASRAIAQLDRIREDRPGATIVVLHHPAKSNPDDPAGSYPVKGNVDTILKVVNEEGIRYMSITKSKESDTSWSSAFELHDIRVPGTNLSSAVFLPAGYRDPNNPSPWD